MNLVIFDGIFSDRDYPFGTILFLFTVPMNLIFIFGAFFINPFDLIPMEFFIFNFVITLCALWHVSQGREWSGDCF